MKKIYETPEMKVVNVKLTTMIAASDPDVTVNKDDTPVDPGKVDSRRYNNVWDEEDEEEF